jgi:hypothetical protein
MPVKAWKLPLYPLLIAAYYPLYMMAADQGMTDVSDVIRPTIVCVLSALFLMVSLGAILRDVHRAALWVAMAVVLIFGIKFAQRIVGRVVEGATGPVAELYILGGMAAIAVLVAVFARPSPNMTRIANVVAAVMVVFPLTSLLQREVSLTAATADTGPGMLEDAGFQAAADTGIRPNIVHILLDGYSRQDVLADLYQFDNTPFLDRLRGLGFAVADRATSPYNQTLLVMGSVFSGTMLESSGRLSSATELRDSVRGHIRHNPVIGSLSRLGYRTAAVDVRYDPVRMDFFDHLLSANTITNFEAAVFERTSLYLVTYNLGFASPSITPEVFSTPYERELTGPFFLYVHLLAPHPPFDVNRHGEAIKQEGGPRGMVDGNHFTKGTPGGQEIYRRGYVEKLEFVNQGILSMIDRIISDADAPTIVIIHGDHGGGLHLHHNDVAGTCIQERFSPLLAVYASDDRLQRSLPDDLNLANLYRLVFNTYFGTEMPLLPNRSVFAGWKNPGQQQTIPPERLAAEPALCLPPASPAEALAEPQSRPGAS